MLQHLQHVVVPLEMQARDRNAVRVLHLGIEIEEIRRRRERRRLDREADRRRIAPLDLALVRRAEPFEVHGVPRVLLASAPGIDRVAVREFLLMRILEVLPARHPRHLVVADVVGKTRLSQQLRQIAVGRLAVQVVAEIASELAARVRDAIRPDARLRVQHDAGGLEARRGHDHHARAHFDFLPGRAIDVRHAARHAVLVDQDVLRERVGPQFEIAASPRPAAGISTASRRTSPCRIPSCRRRRSDRRDCPS